MRIAQGILFVLISVSGFSQTITFGDQTSLYLGDGTVFFFGGNTTLDGTLTNTGSVVSYGDMDLGTNEDIGNIKFIGPAIQKLSGDTIEVPIVYVGDFTVDKDGGLLNVLTKQIEVSGSLNAINGVIKTLNEDDILVTGITMGSGQGYVEGKLFGISKGTPITFPMGINGFPNYMTISNLPLNTRASVEIIIPDQNTLFTNEEMIGIVDDVEWIVKTPSDSVEVTVTIDYSGVDWNTLINNRDTTINSLAYSPAIAVLSDDDTLYHALSGTRVELERNQLPNSSGTLSTDESVWIKQKGTRLALVFIPIISSNVQPTLIPNVFSPRASLAENKVFRVFYSAAPVKEVSISLYDSFNKQVFSVSDSGVDLDLAQYAWNGILNSGLEAPEGVYYYKVRIVPSEGDIVSETGSVLLVK